MSERYAWCADAGALIRLNTHARHHAFNMHDATAATAAAAAAIMCVCWCLNITLCQQLLAHWADVAAAAAIAVTAVKPEQLTLARRQLLPRQSARCLLRSACKWIGAERNTCVAAAAAADAAVLSVPYACMTSAAAATICSMSASLCLQLPHPLPCRCCCCYC
jgi:hypothetical protein